MRSVVAVGSVVVILALIVISAVCPATAASDTPDWMVRPGTIGQAMALPDGSSVYLDAVGVDKIKAKIAEPYFTIHECFSMRDRLVVLSTPDGRLRMNQTVDVSGTLTTLSNGSRAIANPTIYGYTDQDGKLLYHGPLIKGLLGPTPWEWKIDMTVSPTTSAAQARSSVTSSEEPDASPADAPDYYLRIEDITGEQSSAAQSQSFPAHVQDYYSGIPDVQGLPDGSLVELTKKRIIGVGTDTINGTDYDYLDIAEDLPAEDWIRAYYTGDVSVSDRVVSIYAQVRYVDETAVLCVDSGPGYDPQILEGMLMAVSPGKIMFAQTLPDGVSSGDLTGKIVSSNQVDTPNQLYVTEVGNYAGIRVIYTGTATPDKGMTVDVIGTVNTGADGEREILAEDSGVTIPAQPEGSNAKPYGMTNRSLAAGAQDGTGAVVPGLRTDGLLVKAWGQVTSVDASNAFLYIDDGSALHDGSGNTGVKVSWPFSTITPPSVGWEVSVVGDSGIDTVAGHQVRILRPRSLSNPQDVNVFSPSDTNNPDVLTITTPPDGQLHLAPGATSTVISGKAHDAETGIASVQVQIGSGQFSPAIYTASSQVWRYTWQGPATATVTVRATDFAGNHTDYSRTITVSALTNGVIYVDGSSGVDGANYGGSWSTPYATVAYALNNLTGTKDVWVARGTYIGCITMKSNVSLYGGFVGGADGETCREQRNWAANKTILDGNQGGSVVTMPTISGCAVDGFTIRNGRASGGGGGVWCYNSTATVANNIIANNTANSNGGGLGAGGSNSTSNVTITGNVFLNNVALYSGGSASNGGGIWYNARSAGQISNNTVILNTAMGSGGGIYVVPVVSGLPVSNNIVYANNGGGIYGSIYVPAVFAKNDVYGNSGYQYSWSTSYPVGTDLVPVDPGIPYADQGNWHIAGSSPCIDVGVDSAATSLSNDIDCDNRIVDIPGKGNETTNVVDIGADEYDGTDPTPNPTIIYVKPASQGGSDAGSDSDPAKGRTWDRAVATVQKGIDLASNGYCGQVWVATGTYSRAGGATTVANFRSRVKLYGGFAVNDTWADRDWATKPTVLDGGGSGSVVTMNYVIGCCIDGFTIQNGRGSPSGAGIYCYGGISNTIANNIIRGNSCSSYSGGGIYATGSSLTVAGNVLVGNSAWSGAGINCGGAGLIANNTIISNTAGSSGGGISLSGTALSLVNNLIAFNTRGGIYGTSDPVFSKNNVYGNTVYQYSWIPGSQDHPSGDIEPVDPQIAEIAQGDWHISVGSPCRDAGDDSVALQTDTDIDNQVRRYGPIDIGADETSECPYVLILGPVSQGAHEGTSATVTALVRDDSTNPNQPVSGCHIDISVDAGEIVSVTQNGQVVPIGAQAATGITGDDGQVQIVVSRADAGYIHIVSTMNQCGSPVSANAAVRFYIIRYVGFAYSKFHATMGDGRGGFARDVIEAYFQRIAVRYPEVVYSRINDLLSLPSSTYNVVFLGVPANVLTPAEITALSDFVNSGRQKRVVLIGEYPSSWGTYNGYLNTVATGLGMTCQFVTAGMDFDSPAKNCSVVQNHYLAGGVASLWDNDSGRFTTQGQAHPVAYLHDLTSTPWIVEEDIATAGSRIAIHDSNLFDPLYNDAFDTVPTMNFRFVYNLCTILPQ